MKIAKCYMKIGWWLYYRTADGETFSIRKGKHYFYYGNVFSQEKQEVKFLSQKEVAQLKQKIEFVN